MQEMVNLYKEAGYSESKTLANHTWFYWAGDLNRYEDNFDHLTLSNLDSAENGTVVIWETHYSNRLAGDVNKTDLDKRNEYVELLRLTTEKKNFSCSMFQKLTDKDEIIEKHNKFIQTTDSMDASAFYLAGYSYINRFQNAPKAIEMFKKALAVDSNSIDANFALGSVLFNQRNYTEALVYYDKIINDNPKHYNTIIQAGKTLMNLKKFDEARAIFEIVYKAKPELTDPYFFTGLTYYYEKEFDSAHKSFLQVLKLDPKNQDAAFNIGICLLNQNKKDEACKAFTKAIELGSAKATNVKNSVCK